MNIIKMMKLFRSNVIGIIKFNEIKSFIKLIAILLYKNFLNIHKMKYYFIEFKNK